MDFSYNDYEKLINLISGSGYTFCNYHNYEHYDNCVILRHDVDQSIEKAYELACLEHKIGVCSTWFVLLRTDFYNVATTKSLRLIKEMQSMGHEIGLHFDEMAYSNNSNTVENIINEASILSHIIETPVTTVSMHRPSKKTLDANYSIPHIVNSYGETFFNNFKYLSDSRRHWREPIEDIVKSKKYNRLHILTHAIWYSDECQGMKETIKEFVERAKYERYESMKDNIRDLESVIRIEEIQ